MTCSTCSTAISFESPFYMLANFILGILGEKEVLGDVAIMSVEIM